MPDDIHPLPVGTILRAADGSDQYKVILDVSNVDVREVGTRCAYEYAEVGDDYMDHRKKTGRYETDIDELLKGRHSLKQYEIVFRPDE